MKVQIKYLILIFGFIAGFDAFTKSHWGSGIAAAGAFIAFAIIEIQDVKILNSREEE